jgi:hypothetical protein
MAIALCSFNDAARRFGGVYCLDHRREYTALYSRKLQSSYSPPRKSEISPFVDSVQILATVS